MELYGNVRDVQSVQFPWSQKVIIMFNVAYFFHWSIIFLNIISENIDACPILSQV